MKFKNNLYILLLILWGFFVQGYYADPSAQCQAFHVCIPDGLGGLGTQSFLCPNGTIFNQEYFICDWWFNFDCSQVRTKNNRFPPKKYVFLKNFFS